MAKIDWKAVSPDKKREKRDESYLFKLSKDEHSLRLIPFPLKSKSFNSEHLNETNNLFVNLVIHNNDVIPFVNDKMTLSSETFDEYSDPICKFSRQLSYDNKFATTGEGKQKLDIAKGMYPDRHTYCCVVDREDETATPYLWRIPDFKKTILLFERASTKLAKKLKIADDDDDFFELDVNNGFDITVESVIEKPTIGGREVKYRAISSIIFDTEPTPVCESKEDLKTLYGSMINPFSLFHIVSVDELTQVLNKKLNGDDDDDDDDDNEKGKSIASKPKSVVKKKAMMAEDDDDDDEEDEVEEPEEKVAKTKVSEKTKTNQKDFNDLFKAKDKAKEKLQAKATDDDDDDE